MVPLRTEIIIRATRTQNVLGEKGQRIRELTTVIQKRCVLRAAGWCSGVDGAWSIRVRRPGVGGSGPIDRSSRVCVWVMVV